MATAAKRVAVTETVKAAEALAPASNVERLQATERNYSRQQEAQRRKWGLETRAVRSVHVRKF
jgi:muconolactone delta-isomerase